VRLSYANKGFTYLLTYLAHSLTHSRLYFPLVDADHWFSACWLQQCSNGCICI